MPRSNSDEQAVRNGLCRLARRLCASIARQLGALAREQRGATAIFVAASIIPLVGFMGLAVDTTRGYLVKSRLGTAVDAAALAGGRVFTSANRDVDIQMYFDANFPDGYMSAVKEPLQILPDTVNKKLVVSAEVTIPTTFMRLVGIDSIPVAASAEVTIESQNVEVALVLDITGSMAGQKIVDLKAAANELVDIVVQDDQSLFYSKVAIAPYSQAVNVGSYAEQVRGTPPAPKAITNVEKLGTGTSGDPRRIRVTAPNHGFNNGDKIFITGVNAGFDDKINNSTAGSYDSTDSPNFWVVGERTANDFILKRGGGGNINWDPSGSSNDWNGSYSSGGSIFCTTPGCQYYTFLNMSGSWRTFALTTCVTERIGSEAYTDAPPSTAFVGLNYPASSNPCVSVGITPLTSNKADLHAKINSLTASGSTAGQIGTAWGWYLLSPNFSYLWPTGSQPAAYGTPKLMKVAVIMTDGDFNTIYRNGVIASDAGSGSGSNSDHINQNATNGNGFTQALALCNAMKAPGKNIIIYTVGFDLASISSSTARANAENFLNQCATSPSHVYFPESGAEMQDAFRDIALKISKLRLSK